MQRVQQDDAGEPPVRQPVVGQRAIHHSRLDEQRIERAVHPEHLLDPDRPDKRRQDHRHQHQRP